MENVNQNMLTAVSEIQVSYRPKFKASKRPKISSSKDVNKLLIGLWNANLFEYLEEFKILILNRANRINAVWMD